MGDEWWLRIQRSSSIATALALAEAGPGDLSIDHLRGVERSGTLWMLAALGAGIAGAAGARLIAEPCVGLS